MPEESGHVRARGVACPTCKAAVGKKCARPSGHVVFGGQSHRSRWRAAGLKYEASTKPQGSGRIPDNMLVFHDEDLARERLDRAAKAASFPRPAPEPLRFPDEPSFTPTGPAPAPLYSTQHGSLYVGDSLRVMEHLPAGRAQLVLTSPPYALVFKKEYGNEPASAFVEWFMPFVQRMKRLLTPTGILVVNLGPAWNKGSPTMSTYDLETMLATADHLYPIHEMIWHKRGTMPGPAEWVTVRKIRVTNATERIWLFSKDAYALDHLAPDVELDAVLDIPNKASNTEYDRRCRKHGIRQHPARYPPKLAEYFIERLTRPGDLVIDPFAGSNTTGSVADTLGRRWAAIELNPDYARASYLRFHDHPAEVPRPSPTARA